MYGSCRLFSGDRAAARKVCIGTHPSSRSSQDVIDHVTNAAIHGQAFERAWINRCARGRCFQGIHHGVTGIVIVHISTAIQECLEGLGETSFDKQTFSNGGFGSGCPCSRD